MGVDELTKNYARVPKTDFVSKTPSQTTFAFENLPEYKSLFSKEASKTSRKPPENLKSHAVSYDFERTSDSTFVRFFFFWPIFPLFPTWPKWTFRYRDLAYPGL